MALEVRYDEIRSEVIGRLNEQKTLMEKELTVLANTVAQIPVCMEGEAAVAYVNEFTEIVHNIYSKINVNIGCFAEQLETVCQEFENLDSDLNSELTVVK